MKDDFVELVRRSGLIEPEVLDAYVAAIDRVVPPDRRARAGRFVADGLLTRFQADLLLQGRYRDFILDGKYKILDLLGTGGMGRVFLCEHTLLGRKVAVKMLPKSKLRDEASVKRFYREARAVAALRHPNIVQIHDIVQNPNGPLMVMEYVEGVTLEGLVRSIGPLRPERAANYARQAAEGLQHAFIAGMVHRDVKPSNLILDPTGSVKILDLGLAKFFKGQTDTLTRDLEDGAAFGTIDYLAPEQAVSSRTVDIRADIYSLGATLYFLLLGRPPFPEGTVTQKLIAHQQTPPSPPRSERPEIPEGMEAVLLRMLAKSPNDRPQTPGAVAADLAEWAGGRVDAPSTAELYANPTQSLVPTRAMTGLSAVGSSVMGPPPALPPRRNRRGLWASMVLGVAMAVGVAAVVVWAGSSGGPLTPAEAIASPDGTEITVEFRIEDTGYTSDKSLCFLNSSPDHTSPDNFSIVIDREVVRFFPELPPFESIGQTLTGREVTVTGRRTTFRQQRPQIKLAPGDRVVVKD